MTWPRVGCTAHRQIEAAGGEEWTRAELARAARWLRERGTRVGVSGLARGGDTWWAEAVLDAGLQLWLSIPFEEQCTPWPKRQQARWRELRAAASRERVVGRLPEGLPAKARSAAVNKLLFQRNAHLVGAVNALVAVWEPGRLDGGTTGALILAARRGLPGVHLDPAARRVAFELPGLDRLEKYALYHRSCGCVAGVGVQPEVELRRRALDLAGYYYQWRVRRAKPRETRSPGCDTCRVDSSRAAVAPRTDWTPRMTDQPAPIKEPINGE